MGVCLTTAVRALRLSLLVTVVSLPLHTLAQAVAPSQAGDTGKRVAEALLADRNGLGAALSSLGPNTLPALVEVLEHRSFVLEGERYVLTRDQRERVVQATVRLPDRVLQAWYEDLLDPAVSIQKKAVGIELIGVDGGAEDLSLMLKMVRSDADAQQQRTLGRRLESELAKVLARDARGFSMLGDLIQDATVMHDGAAREPIVRAMGQGRSKAAVSPLAYLLGAFPELDGAILGQIARVSVGERCTADEGALDRIRPYLQDEEPQLQVGSALVLGRLEDFHSVPTLIEFLEHPHKGLREQSLWSLRRISRLGLSQDPDRWSSWHRREVEWWEEQSGELFEQLHSQNSAVVAEAVNLIARRRLFRHELAKELTRALSHRDVNVLRQCCYALSQLDSPSAIQALIDCLSIPQPTVREAAWESLKEITGRDLPPIAQEWRDAFPG
jgi:hypothetical protein